MSHSLLPSLSDSLKLRASIFLRLQLATPWGFALPETADLRFHVMTRGSCLLGGDDPPIRLGEGDIVLLARGQRHWIADQPDSHRLAMVDAARMCQAGQPPFQAEPSSHRLICGQAQMRDQASRWMLQLMPAVLHFKPDDLDARVWRIVEAIGANEISLTNDDTLVLDRLAEALFLSLLGRAADMQLATGPMGAAYRDPQLRTVLSLMHSQFDRPWTLEDLAARAAMSRATLARRFKDAMGLPVMSYLGKVRMTQAAKLLHAGSSLEAVAHQTGYGSPEAFRKAFRRHVGTTPSRYLRDSQTS